MGTLATSLGRTAAHPVQVALDAPPAVRNRLTVAFRPILGIPHAILVGGPIAVFAWTWGSPDGTRLEWGAGGVLGAVAAVCAIIAWFAILVTGRHPAGLRDLAAYYLRWRARAVSYLMLLRDGFPPVVIHSIERQRYYDVLRSEAAGLVPLVLESLDNGVDTASRFFSELEEARRQLRSAS